MTDNPDDGAEVFARGSPAVYLRYRGPDDPRTNAETPL